MYKYRKVLVLAGIILGILGALLHFVYDWSGQMRLVGLFVPVNESTWEHMKLFFFPMLAISLYINRKYASEIPLLLSGLLFTTLLGTWLIPVLFYTYRGILGFDISVLNISTYYVSLLISFYYLWVHTFSASAIAKNKQKQPSQLLPFLTALQAILFSVFTYHPLSLGIFSDPIGIPRI